MSGIKLRENNGYIFIDEPSGNRVSASKLVVGRIYLHENLNFYRKIDDIDDGIVYYHDQFGGGSCGKGKFASVCAYEITPEELDFLTKK